MTSARSVRLVLPLLALCLSAVASAASAQTMTDPTPYSTTAARPRTLNTSSVPGYGTTTQPRLKRNESKPLSRVSLGVGVSPLGIGFLLATNINRYLDVRGTGNFLNYSINNINTNGFNVNANLNLA